MPRTFKHLTFILAAFLTLLPAVSRAQWDVTDQGDATAIDALKEKKFDLKQEPSGPIEMQADQVQYNSGNNSAEASGNVVVKSGKTMMYADKLVMDRTRQEAQAQGHLYLDSPQFAVDADEGKFNFTEKTGEFTNARIFYDPLQMKGRKISKVSDNHIVMQDGYMTTSDWDKPEYRIQSRQMDIYPGDRMVARGVKLYIGQVPVLYLPRFTQDLKDKPWFTFAPGYKKDLGAFLLTRSRFKINENWTSTVRLDYYERMGFGWGTENKYKTPSVGEGIVRTYFINEHAIAAKHPWETKTQPTINTDRYQGEWRHKWDINDKTTAIWQYYRLSDNVILKRYFERDYRREPDPPTYFLLTRAMAHGTLSLRVDHRVNPFVAAIDRTPEVRYEASGIPVGDSGFYWKTSSGVSNLVARAPNPTEDRKKTFRVDTDNEVSYPTHVSFVQVTPMVGGTTTYYSRTAEDPRREILRNSFKTGVDLSARFLKVMNVRRDFWGIKIDRLRHIIAPGISYRYQHEPTFLPAGLNQFDTAIDGLDRKHVIGLSLENKLQTKRGKQVVDLVRNLTTADYMIQRDGQGDRLGPVKNLLELMPYDWLKMVSEFTMDDHNRRLSEGNFDMYFNAGKKFGVGVGDRYVRGGDHEFVTQLAYVINPKWRFKTYNRWALNTGDMKEQGYIVTRDLHAWEMDMMYNKTQSGGHEVMMTFRLKAFPSQPFQLFGTTFYERKAGAASTSN